MTVISFVALFAVLVAMAAAAPKPDEKYTTKYDGVNIKDILENDRLLAGYLKCLKGKGTCTPDVAELKKTLPDALNTECAKCSPTQKEKSEEVLRYLVENKKTEFDELVAIYDPTGAHKASYAKYAEEKGIKL